MAFLQMIKQSNVIIVFIFSLMIGLEKLLWQRWPGHGNAFFSSDIVFVPNPWIHSPSIAQRYRTNLVVVLLCIMLATGLTVQGELHFSMLGQGLRPKILILIRWGLQALCAAVLQLRGVCEGGNARHAGNSFADAKFACFSLG